MSIATTAPILKVSENILSQRQRHLNQATRTYWRRAFRPSRVYKACKGLQSAKLPHRSRQIERNTNEAYELVLITLALDPTLRYSQYSG